jgi:hypothetical protein
MEQTLSLDWDLLWRRRWLITVAAILFSLLAVTWYVYTPREWAAVGMLRVGSVISDAGRDPSEVPIEPVAASIDRMLSPVFIRDAARAAGYPAEEAHLLSSAYGGLGRVQIMPLPGTNLISVRVVTDQALKSRQIAQALVVDFVRDQNDLIKPLRDDRAAQVQALRRELTLLAEDHTPDGDRLSLTLTRAAILSELVRAQQAISFPRLVETQAIGTITVLAKPVSPRPLVAAALAVTLSLLFAFGVLAWDWLRRRCRP